MRGDIAPHVLALRDVAPHGAAPIVNPRYQGLAPLATLLGPSRANTFIAFLALCVAWSSSLHAAETPPNIILIVVDDLGHGELGCYGQQHIRTPRIDQLAAEGIRFTQFYAGAPVCAPSRCTLMTGKHTGHAAIRDNREDGPWRDLAHKYEREFIGQEPLPQEEITLAELLKSRGYATAAIGKWGLGHVGTPGAPNVQGFDLFYGFYCQRHAHNHYPQFLWRNDVKETLPGNDGKQLEGQTYSQDKFIENGLDFIRQHRDGPFFLYLPVTVPHLAIQAPAEAVAEYAGELPETPYTPPAGRGSQYVKHPTPHAGYAAMITHLDRGVGQIVDLVHELGLDERTLILFTSDNGPTYERLGGADSDFFNSARGLRGRKGSVYEGGLRIPLIARWSDKIEPNLESNQVAAMWDLLPTLAAAAGAAVPDAVDGVSLLDTLIKSSPLPEREMLYWGFPAYGGQQAVRCGDWKGVRTELNQGPQKWQLYDLSTDETESFDVADEHPDVVDRIKQLANEAHVDSPNFPLAVNRED